METRESHISPVLALETASCYVARGRLNTGVSPTGCYLILFLVVVGLLV